MYADRDNPHMRATTRKRETAAIAAQACVMGGAHDPRAWSGEPSGVACRKCHKTWFHAHAATPPHLLFWPYVAAAITAEAYLDAFAQRTAMGPQEGTPS